jgi:hypothetical protein
MTYRSGEPSPVRERRRLSIRIPVLVIGILAAIGVSAKAVRPAHEIVCTPIERGELAFTEHRCEVSEHRPAGSRSIVMIGPFLEIAPPRPPGVRRLRMDEGAAEVSIDEESAKELVVLSNALSPKAAARRVLRWGGSVLQWPRLVASLAVLAVGIVLSIRRARVVLDPTRKVLRTERSTIGPFRWRVRRLRTLAR